MCVGRLQVQQLLKELGTYGIEFRSYDAAFLAQPTPVDDELHMAASCLAYFKVRLLVGCWTGLRGGGGCKYQPKLNHKQYPMQKREEESVA